MIDDDVKIEDHEFCQLVEDLHDTQTVPDLCELQDQFKYSNLQVSPKEVPKENNKIAVAVSGGADSNSLMLLVSKFAKKRKMDVTILTVDHRLRPDSTDEALKVSEWAKKLGFKHVILTPEIPLPKGCSQSKAREARYRLLLDWCEENDCNTLYLGHHLNDQLETFMLRLINGSGLLGLSCMRPLSFKFSSSGKKIRIMRPLLGFSKNQLISTLEHHNHEWIEDPSNFKSDYTRNVIRQYLKEFELLKEKERLISKSIAKIGAVKSYLEKDAEKFIKEHFYIDSRCGYADVDIESILEIGRVLGGMVLNMIAKVVSGNEYIDDLIVFSDFLDNLIKGEKNSLSSSGCVFKVQKGRLWICPDSRAEEIIVSHHGKFLWDNRIVVQLKIEENEDVTIKPIGKKMAAKILSDPEAHGFQKCPLPDFVITTIPGVFNSQDNLIAAPLGIYERDDLAEWSLCTRKLFT